MSGYRTLPRRGVEGAVLRPEDKIRGLLPAFLSLGPYGFSSAKSLLVAVRLEGFGPREKSVAALAR